MFLGLYKHYKGGWYIGLCQVWESTNDEIRRAKVLYLSLGNLIHFKWRQLLNVRWRAEFCGIVGWPRQGGRYERFRRIFPPWQP